MSAFYFLYPHALPWFYQKLLVAYLPHYQLKTLAEKWKERAREMALSIKYMEYECEGLSSNPQHSRKIRKPGCALLYL